MNSKIIVLYIVLYFCFINVVIQANRGGGGGEDRNNDHDHGRHHGGDGGGRGDHHDDDRNERRHKARYDCSQRQLDHVERLLGYYYKGLSSGDFTPMYPYYADDIVFHYVEELVWKGKATVEAVFNNANLNFNYQMGNVSDYDQIVGCKSAMFRVNRTISSARSKRTAVNFYNFYLELNQEGKITFMEEQTSSESLRYVLNYFFDNYNDFCDDYTTHCTGANNAYGSLENCVHYASQLPFKKPPITLINFFGDSLICRNIALTPAVLFDANDPNYSQLVQGACLSAGPASVSPMCA